MNKKADGGLTAIVIIVIIILFIAWLISIGGRECNVKADCGSDQYCASDFSCHDIPVKEKIVTVTGEATNAGRTITTNLVPAAIILGLCLIIAAFIFKLDSIKDMFKKKGKKAEPVQKEETDEERREKMNMSKNAEDKGMYQEEIED